MRLGATLLSAGCAQNPELDTGGFHVVGSTPIGGEEDVIEVIVPELRFSEAANEETCGTTATSLDAVDDAGVVLFHVETVAVFTSVGEKLQLEHDIPLNAGYSYALSVRSAASASSSAASSGSASAADADLGCTSLTGEGVAPFYARFRVP